MTDFLSIEDVVRRLSRRPGFRLVTYREVALPFWEVPVRCRVLAKKELPVVDEFILRSIEVDLRTSNDVSAFLGIPTGIVDAVMAKLLLSNYIIPTTSDDAVEGLRYTTSATGKEILVRLAEITVQDRTLNVAYDGVKRCYQLVDAALRWRPQDLRKEDVLEIPAFPADPPEVSPNDTQAIADALDAVTKKTNVDIVATIGIDGKRTRFFVRGLALIFESVDSPDDIYVHFAIDGRPSEDHDRAFSRAEGQRKLGILDSLRLSSPVAESILNQSVLDQRVDESEVTSLRRTTDLYKAQLLDLENQSKLDVEESDDTVPDQITDVAQKLDEAQKVLDRLPVRTLEVHEHPPVLVNALETAQSRLLIISPWIRAAVVDNEFAEKIRWLLELGTRVSIGYGIDDGKKTSEKDLAAERMIAGLRSNYSNFDFARLGDTHAKILIVDSRYAVVTSFNWLSFRGHPDRPFRDERGTLITIESEIDRLYDDYFSRIQSVNLSG